MQPILELKENGRLVLPEKTLRKLSLSAGKRFKLLTDDDGVIVLKLLDSEVNRSSVTESELRLQQEALEKIWNNPAEDIYNDEI